jgi:RNA polymerase sigma-70 factor (ECF subfamily)
VATLTEGREDLMSAAGYDPETIVEMIARAVAGDSEAWHHLVTEHRERLRRMVALRLDPRLRGRVDPSDIIQETLLEATRQLGDYQRDPPLPFYLWLRQLAGTRLAKAHRHHLGTHRRDVRREVVLPGSDVPGVSSAALAEHLASRDNRPSEAAAHAELRHQLETLLDQLDPMDREVLALRHFEQLHHAEAARVLGLTEAAASKRYLRALERLRERLASSPGGLEL